MTENPRRIGYSRITLALGAVTDPEPMIELAGVLARAAGARLHGVLLEDRSLFDLAELPFSTSISAGPSRTRTPLTAVALEAAFARQERLFRKILGRLPAGSEPGWSFERRRGVLPEVIGALAEDELLLVAPDTETGEAEAALVSVRGGTARIGGFGLLTARASRHQGPIMALVDPGPGAERVLDLARRLASGTGRPIEILVLGGDDEAAKEILARSESGAGSEPAYERLAEKTESALKAKIAETRPSLLVGDLHAWPFDDHGSGASAVQACRCPVILLRC